MQVRVVPRKDELDVFPPLGEARKVKCEDGTVQLLLRCPKCGQCYATQHCVEVDAERRPTVSPSIVCPVCGWHGWLRNGEMTTAGS